MSPRAAFTARTPVDLVAIVPYLLGFHPADSVVLLTFGPGEAFHARVDLPGSAAGQQEVVAMLAGVARQHRVGRAAVLLYTEDPSAARSVHDLVVPALLSAGTEVIDVLRVGPERFHSACDVDDPGTAYDLSTHPFTAAQVLEGKVTHRSRADLAATLDVVDTADARAVAEAADRFDDELHGVSQFARVPRLRRELADHGRWVRRTIRRHVRLGTPLSVDDAGRLLLLMSMVPVRDVAWAEMSRPTAHQHLDLWRDLLRRCPTDLVPPAASLLAFAAWLAGDGALAWCALDRSAEVDPEYSLADCVAGLLERAVPPSVWTPLTDADLPVFWSAPGEEAS